MKFYHGGVGLRQLRRSAEPRTGSPCALRLGISSAGRLIVYFRFCRGDRHAGARLLLWRACSRRSSRRVGCSARTVRGAGAHSVVAAENSLLAAPITRITRGSDGCRPDAFLPDAAAGERPPRSVKMSYLTVFFGVQHCARAVLLDGRFPGRRPCGAVDPLLGVEGNFPPRAASALQLADSMLQTGSHPPLADFAIDHYRLVWLPMIGLIYVQLMALPAALRPRLHTLWGYLLIAFHVGTGLSLQIFRQALLGPPADAVLRAVSVPADAIPKPAPGRSRTWPLLGPLSARARRCCRVLQRSAARARGLIVDGGVRGASKPLWLSVTLAGHT